MTEEQQQKRFQLVCQLGWDNACLAERLVKQGCFRGWSLKQLGQRYRAVLLERHSAPITFGDTRIDDGFIEWEQRFGAECRALEYLMEQARRQPA